MDSAKQQHRIVLCMGTTCNQDGQAEPLYERLTQRLGDLAPAWSSLARDRAINWEIGNCFDMCAMGPNVVVHPGRICHNAVDLYTLEQIVAELEREAEV